MFLNHNFYEKGEEIFKGFIVKEIHGGSDKSGFGVVYITYHEKSGEYLAIKTLQNEEFTQKDFKTFQEEINPWELSAI